MNWKVLFDKKSDVNDLVEIYEKVLSEMIDRHFPIEKRKI